MASILNVDTISGKTTAGSISITGEGNSTTTNLQQGLCKMWCRVNYSGGTPIDSDSLNVSSLDDDGTGDIDYNFTNNVASTNCSTVGSSASSSTATIFVVVETTANARTLQSNNAGNAADFDNSISLHGDLA